MYSDFQSMRGGAACLLFRWQQSRHGALLLIAGSHAGVDGLLSFPAHLIRNPKIIFRFRNSDRCDANSVAVEAYGTFGGVADLDTYPIARCAISGTKLKRVNANCGYSHQESCHMCHNAIAITPTNLGHEKTRSTSERAISGAWQRSYAERREIMLMSTA
jgi:hypothetical protein